MVSSPCSPFIFPFFPAFVPSSCLSQLHFFTVLFLASPQYIVINVLRKGLELYKLTDENENNYLAKTSPANLTRRTNTWYDYSGACLTSAVRCSALAYVDWECDELLTAAYKSLAYSTTPNAFASNVDRSLYAR